jgi:hypothetical protein
LKRISIKPILEIDATRAETDLVVEDLDVSQNNMIQYKSKNHDTSKKFYDTFTIKNN